MSKELDRLMGELELSQHAMQSGVKFKMDHDPGETSPKHLRVGVNASMVFHGALVRLLVEKGVFTDEEYASAMVNAMDEEVTKYEKYLSEATGLKVTLR